MRPQSESDRAPAGSMGLTQNSRSVGSSGVAYRTSAQFSANAHRHCPLHRWKMPPRVREWTPIAQEPLKFVQRVTRHLFQASIPDLPVRPTISANHELFGCVLGWLSWVQTHQSPQKSILRVSADTLNHRFETRRRCLDTPSTVPSSPCPNSPEDDQIPPMVDSSARDHLLDDARSAIAPSMC